MNTEQRVYTDTDLDYYKNTIEQATRLWAAYCLVDYHEHGDCGSCVLGAGIELLYKAPGKKKVEFRTVIHASTVAAAQGSLNWEGSYKKVMEFMASKGMDGLSYDYGRMD